MTEDPSESPADPIAEGSRPHRNFYGRTRGKPLRQGHRDLLEGALDAVRVRGATREENPARAPIPVPGGGAPLWVEVGFGSGEHLVHAAALHPEVTIIGAEPFVNGVATLLAKLAREPRPNVLIHPGDARDLLEVLPGESVQRAFLLYPDPWPKARHHRRRFVTPEPLGLLARAMAAGAELRVATDVEDYARQALEEVPGAGFALAAGPTGEPWPDWPSTRYERKALREGRPPLYLTFRRA